MREPGFHDRAERRFVGREFLQDLALGAAVRQDVEKVEHHRNERHALEGIDLPPRVDGLFLIIDLEILRWPCWRRAQALELKVEQLTLEAVARALVVSVLLP